MAGVQLRKRFLSDFRAKRRACTSSNRATRRASLACGVMHEFGVALKQKGTPGETPKAVGCAADARFQ